jgi:hypothetical protein
VPQTNDREISKLHPEYPLRLECSTVMPTCQCVHCGRPVTAKAAEALETRSASAARADHRSDSARTAACGSCLCAIVRDSDIVAAVTRSHANRSVGAISAVQLTARAVTPGPSHSKKRVRACVCVRARARVCVWFSVESALYRWLRVSVQSKSKTTALGLRAACASLATWPSPGADMTAVSPLPVQMWQRRAQSRSRCDSGEPSRAYQRLQTVRGGGEPSPSADVAGSGPSYGIIGVAKGARRFNVASLAVFPP